jgi:hypothetical protein
VCRGGEGKEKRREEKRREEKRRERHLIKK